MIKPIADFEDIPACAYCGAMVGACASYPNCPNGTARFYIDHGMIHDKVTGRHVTTMPDSEELNDGTVVKNDCYGMTITETCALLNELAAARGQSGAAQEATTGTPYCSKCGSTASGAHYANCPEILPAPPAREPSVSEGEVVVTTDGNGGCILVSRQDDEGRILSVIWEVPTEEHRVVLRAEYAKTMAALDAVKAELCDREQEKGT